MSLLVVLSKENDRSFASEARPPLDLASSCCVLDCNLVLRSCRHQCVCVCVRMYACASMWPLAETHKIHLQLDDDILAVRNETRATIVLLLCNCCGTHTRPSVRYRCHTYKHPPHTHTHTFFCTVGMSNYFLHIVKLYIYHV